MEFAKLGKADYQMSSQRVTISPEFKKQVWLVAFDMDQTALDLHTSGVAVRDDQLFPPLFFDSQFVPLKAKEILDHVKDAIKIIIPELLQNGIAVAICTNTDVKMACHTSLMGGRELVEYIFGNTFSDYPDICNRLVIEAWRGLGDVPRVDAWIRESTCSTAAKTTI